MAWTGLLSQTHVVGVSSMWSRTLWVEIRISARAGAGALDRCFVGHG